MTDHTPTSNQRTLLDVIGNIPSEWRVDVTYPTLPQVAHSFDLLPELVLTNDTGEVTEEVAVRASITDDKVFHGFVVTTTYPEPAVLTAECRDRRLTSLSQGELLSEPLSITHHRDLAPGSDTAVAHAHSLSAAASLAGYYAATVEMDASQDADQSPVAASPGDD